MSGTIFPGSMGSGWLSGQTPQIPEYNFGAGIPGIAPSGVAPTADSWFNRNFGAPGTGSGTGLGFNMGTGQLALGGLQALGNLMGSMQANSLAKKQFNFTRDFANTNLANQIKSYNTRLEDKYRSRGVTEGRESEWADEQINRNRLSR